MGKKFSPHYRIIAIQARTKRNGRALEELGFYNPMSKELKINKERAEHWLSVGAQPTPTVEALLVKESVLKEKKGGRKFEDKPKSKSVERKAAKEEKAKAKKEAEAATKEEAKQEAEAPKEDPKVEPETAEESNEEVVEETKAEEAPAKEAKEEKAE